MTRPHLRVWVEDPDSAAIAASLAGHATCEHLRDPCILRCGVRRVGGKWVVIPKEERLAWRAEEERL